MTLTQGKYALIDAADFSLVSPYTWCAGRYRLESGKEFWYALSNQKQPDGTYRHLKMHRLILGASTGQLVDHVDGDGLNNRRENLRIATAGQNQYNAVSRFGTSRYKGVGFHKGSGRWQASIRKNGKLRHLGTFKYEEDAALAYDLAALREFKGFARTNFPRRLLELFSDRTDVCHSDRMRLLNLTDPNERGRTRERRKKSHEAPDHPG